VPFLSKTIFQLDGEKNRREKPERKTGTKKNRGLRKTGTLKNR
jgi:hypothetical protein